MSTPRPTILQIIPELDTGGAELSTVEIAEAVVRAGGRAIVLSQGGRMEDDLAAAGGELIRFPAGSKNPLTILSNARRIAAICEQYGVRLVHARSRAPAWSAKLAAKRAGVAFVTTYHGAYSEKGPIKRWYNAVMAAGEVVIANSCYTRDLILERYGTDPDKLRVIYRGLDEARFDPAAVGEGRVEALKEIWGIGDEQRVILNAARLTNWKGQRVLIAACERLARRGELGDACVVLAGDDQGRSEYRKGLEAQIEAAGLSDRVRLVGHVSDIPAALKLAHLAVVASIEPEAFGRAAAEAQAMMCPVVATDIGAPPETVLAPPRVAPDERTGWLVPPSDPGAMAEAMSEALALSPEAREATGRRAREHVTRSFSLDNMKRQTLAVYDELLGTQLEAAYRASR